MLVLSRKLGEAISIAENITVKLVHVGNGRVRLGIEAPGDIPIRRSPSGQQQTQAPTTVKELEAACVV